MARHAGRSEGSSILILKNYSLYKHMLSKESMQTKSGFSLIELLIVLTLIAILSAMGIISFTSFQKESQTEILKSQLFRAIQLTRSEAIFRNQRIILCSSRNQKTCDGDWQSGFIVKTTENVLHAFQPFSIDGILHWRAFPLDREHLEFLSSGIPNAENGTFWFCVSSRIAWAIMMNKSGRLHEIKPNQHGVILDHKGIALPC